MTQLVGQSIGPYSIIERIGAGGMAEVYKAFHADLSVYRALKVIRPEFSLAQDFRTRFQQEARSVASLRHPNIVQVHDFGAHNDAYYMVMEFIEGEDLRRLVRARGQIRPIKEAVDLVVQVANALEYAHARSVIHRDIKPENIMITPSGQPILTDFGIAKILTEGTRLTQTGAAIGSPAYMAPEQALGTHEMGPPVDVYALTVVLFELLTGRTPYPANTPVAAILKSISDPLPMPRSLSSDIGEALQDVMLKGAAKDVAERFQSVASLRDALIDAVQSDARSAAGQTTLVTTLKRVDDSRRREAGRRRTAIAASLAAIVVASGAAIWSLGTRQTDGGGIVAFDAPPSTQLESDDADASATPAPALDSDAQLPRDETAYEPNAAPERATAPPLLPPDEQQAGEAKAVRSSSVTTPPVSTVADGAMAARNESVAASTPTLDSQQTAAGRAADTPFLAPTMTTPLDAGSHAPGTSGGLDQVRKGETTQGDLIRLFGGPNLTTLDEAGRETWIYERTLTQTDVSTSSQASQATARLGLFFGSAAVGGAADKSSSGATMATKSTVRSVTVIVKFAPDRTVYDYAVRETYF